MLVLTRKLGKSISLFDKDNRLLCELTVLDVDAESRSKSNYKVKLGFTAPDDIKIMRNELLTNKENANHATSDSKVDADKVAGAA